MSCTVDIQHACEFDNLPTDTQFQTWVNLALGQFKPNAELTILLAEPSQSQALNSQYRGKDKPTNVLSFPFEAPPEIELPLIGDLVICPQVVFQEAQQQEKPFHDHFAHMVVHGCLHLIGFDHINDQDAQEMEQLEKKLLQQINISDPYRDEA